ncbi:hypothetical protein [Amnibacterium endophyticum]|uniref:Uncharacterized protein n=1 Tax=Amnibacterium endophyticum TaxID=2109337 RepID=A0ABW4L9W3_9MICO
MAQVLVVIGVIAVAWIVVASVVALLLGRAVRIADDRQKAQMAYRRPARSAQVARPAARRVPARAS